ncbi:MAG TPA: hypothetical protein VMV49_16290 [Candidatus Deferrimicrobium sp.]|nr:hypothetical protein [Candidatus Deferrimicrobium sp.]
MKAFDAVPDQSAVDASRGRRLSLRPYSCWYIILAIILTYFALTSYESDRVIWLIGLGLGWGLTVAVIISEVVGYMIEKEERKARLGIKI